MSHTNPDQLTPDEIVDLLAEEEAAAATRNKEIDDAPDDIGLDVECSSDWLSPVRPSRVAGVPFEDLR